MSSVAHRLAPPATLARLLLLVGVAGLSACASTSPAIDRGSLELGVPQVSAPAEAPAPVLARFDGEPLSQAALAP